MCSDRQCPDRVKHADARRPYVTGEAVIGDGAWEEKQREDAQIRRYEEAIEKYNKGEIS